MNLLNQLAETHIQEAIERGDLRDLPGAGQSMEDQYRQRLLERLKPTERPSP